MTEKKKLEKRFARLDIEDSIARCVRSIEKADCVAFDLEFSGLVLDPANPQNYKKSLADYYSHCRKSVKKFIPLQLGVCTGRYNSEQDKWVLTPYAFYCCPASAGRIFSSDIESLKFLAGQNFDISKWAVDAIPFSRLAFDVNNSDEHQDTKTTPKACKKNELRAVFAACASKKVPMIFHHGWLDMLHVFHSFIDDLPKDVVAFGKQWKNLFGPTLDTKHIADQHRWSVFNRVHSTSLTNLNSALLVDSNDHLPDFIIRDDIPDIPNTTSNNTIVSERQEHDAGADALLTCKIFIAMKNMLAAAPKSGVKRRKKASHSTNEDSDNINSVLTPIVTKGGDLQNVIAVCGAPPGHFRL